MLSKLMILINWAIAILSGTSKTSKNVQLYIPPVINVIEIEVERGFAQSTMMPDPIKPKSPGWD